MRMDRNYNQAVIRKLAKRSQVRNRARNFFACLAITLSTALIFAFLLYLDGSQTEKLRLQAHSKHVTYENITLDQLEQLRQDARIVWAGGEQTVGRKKIGSVRLNVAWLDKKNLENDHISYAGEYPEGERDIMVSQEYLDLLEEVATNSGQLQPGDTISLDLGDGVVREYRISAVYDKPSKAKNSQNIYVSLPCAAMLLAQEYQPGQESVNAIVSLKNAVGMSMEDAVVLTADIAANAGISAEQTKLNDVFFTTVSLSKLTKGDYLTFFTVALLLFVAAGIVIHTVFYISIAGRVREYGQLRTIGMTKKQIKQLILREGTTLALRGAMAGLLLGGLLGYVLVPDGFDLLRCLCAALLCALLAYAIVLLSLWKPGSIAASTAPIAALGYSGYSEAPARQKNLWHRKTFQSSKDRRSKMSPPDYLAFLNLKRNRKKRILTLCSLMLSGILLGTITSYVVSCDPTASVKASFPNGEYQLMISQDSGFGGDDSLDGRMKQQSFLQANGLLGEELQTELQQQKGVANVQPWRLLFGCTTLFATPKIKEMSLYLNGISESDFALLQQMTYEGPASYEELFAQPGLIVINNYLTQLQENPLSIGDTVPFCFYDGTGRLREEELPVIAVVDPTVWSQKNRLAYLPLSLMGSTFMMPNQALDQLAGMNTTYGYEIKTEPGKTTTVGLALEALYDLEENLYLASKQENTSYYQKEFRSTQIILYSLAAFLVIFGVINLINTLLTNLYSRKQELGILQAVGMTESQLRRMLHQETAHYTKISALCTLLPGGLLGYALVMAQLLAGFEMTYTYPWLPVLLYILLLFFLQRGITRYGIKLLQKESLVERMKHRY